MRIKEIFLYERAQITNIHANLPFFILLESVNHFVPTFARVISAKSEVTTNQTRF